MSAWVSCVVCGRSFDISDLQFGFDPQRDFALRDGQRGPLNPSASDCPGGSARAPGASVGPT